MWWLRKRLLARRVARRTDAQLVRRSPCFDERWYHQQVGLSAGEDAVEHYLQTGYREGFDPSPRFSGELYGKLNPDVRAAGVNPLAHYERYGRIEGRRTGMDRASCWAGYREYRLLRGLARRLGQMLYGRAIRRHATARVLVHCHVFYAAAIPEMCQYLRNLAPYAPTLAVSYVEGSCTPADLAAFEAVGASSVAYMSCENRGYDLAPFFHLLEDVDLDAYDIVYKLHSKGIGRERLVFGQRFGKREWFCRLWGGIAGPLSAHRAIGALLREDGADLVAERKVLAVREPAHVRRMVRRVLEGRGLALREGSYSFVAGTCFAVRATALVSQQAAHISPRDFEEVRYGTFSLAHALERWVSGEVERQGGVLQGIATLRLWEAWSALVARVRYRSNGQRIREAMGLRFSDDDLLCLDGIFYDSWERMRVRVGDLRVRDAQGVFLSLREAVGRPEGLWCKYGDPWEPREDLSAFVEAHYLRRDDAALCELESVPWSQAIVVNEDGFVMCGHDVANCLLHEQGPDAEVEVVRYRTKRL